VLFNSLHFALFFPIVTALYFALPARARWGLLLAASCYFYMAFVPVYILILAATIVVDLVARRLPTRYGFGPGDVEVLSPMHRGDAGVGALNTVLQERLTPAKDGVPEARGGGRVYRPGEEEGFDVAPEGDGRFRISGRGIELLIARHDIENPEALDYLEGRLREIGVIAALERAGFERGDEVVVGDLEFELDPG
jgi:Obg family GTPase CgtA-like protein